MKIVKHKIEYTVLELPEIEMEVKIDHDRDTIEIMSRDLGSSNDNEWEDTSADTLIDYFEDQYQSPAEVAKLLRNPADLLSPPAKPRKPSKNR